MADGSCVRLRRSYHVLEQTAASYSIIKIYVVLISSSCMAACRDTHLQWCRNFSTSCSDATAC